MYCVKCGVRLQDGAERCPLCGTPVIYPQDGGLPRQNYPPTYPQRPKGGHYAAASFITVFLAAVCLSCLIFCLSTYGDAGWSGYVTLGIAAAYVIAFMHMWFRHPHPMIFLPLSFCAVGGYLLYVCLRTDGDWFLTFALPVTAIACAITVAAAALFRYLHRGRLFITGGLLIAIGGAAVLVELFQHITFGTRMFLWSLYPLSAFGLLGIFLILAGIIRPLRNTLEKKFFL